MKCFYHQQIPESNWYQCEVEPTHGFVRHFGVVVGCKTHIFDFFDGDGIVPVKLHGDTVIWLAGPGGQICRAISVGDDASITTAELQKAWLELRQRPAE